jgi:hypothetical protein
MIIVDINKRSVSALFYQTFHYVRTSYPFHTLKWMTNKTWEKDTRISVCSRHKELWQKLKTPTFLKCFSIVKRLAWTSIISTGTNSDYLNSVTHNLKQSQHCNVIRDIQRGTMKIYNIHARWTKLNTPPTPTRAKMTNRASSRHLLASKIHKWILCSALA